MALPDVIKAKSHGEWPSRGLSRGTPDPYMYIQASLFGHEGKGGPSMPSGTPRSWRNL